MLLKTKPIKSKKAVSVIVGYVLLIVFAIVLGGITYTWIKTYIPSQQNLECQDGVSVFVKKSVLNTTTTPHQLKITIKNTGRFSVAGYFIHATNESSQELATIDLSGYLNTTPPGGGVVVGNSVLFFLGDNNLKSGEEKNHVFDIPLELGTLYNVRITPVRYQEIENRNRFVSCVSAITEQVIGEDIGACVPDEISITCGSRECGSVVNNCNALVLCPPGCSTGTDSCDALGVCISESCTPASDPTLSGMCGDQTCGTAVNGTCGSVSCPPGCGSGFDCNATNQCEANTCNGTWVPPESAGVECDGGTDCQVDCSCPAGYIIDGSGGCTTIGNGNCDSGETCAEEPEACEGQIAQCPAGVCNSGICVSTGGISCINYCLGLGLSYTTSTCPANLGQCNSQNGDTSGNGPGLGGYDECTLSGATGNYVCCCKPKNA